jgi:NAD(P)-dependent dehydrogenase (short-subunit alcohol dehydrogenase family)
MKRARSQRSLLQTLVLSTALCAPTFFASPTFAQSVAPPKFAKIEYDPNYLPTDSKQNKIEATPLAEIRENFAEPGKEFATAPLWTWKDLLTEEQVREKYINQVPMKRSCEYKDIEDVMVFLASDYSGYMTGQAINVTGGQQM